ncbi:neuraminidase-like domain-containing protein [Streptomyces sp. R21]|uniref:Neuraminidase-like domain-containing protein n=1 Tax=Streptomyces sp. R21 TaxID=3238627 RepID=A0AB39P3D6_9ACTN
MSETDRQGTVTGTVTRPDGSGAAGVTITVSARLLRTERPVGEAVTDASGRYRIPYTSLAGPPDLVVRAAADGYPGTETVLENPGPATTADLVLPPDGRSEYATVLADLAPHLDGTSLADLNRGDFAYLARVTGRDPLQCAHLTTADGHATATGLSAEAFYGLLRQGLGPGLAQLVARPEADLGAALHAAADAGTIGPGLDADAFVTALRVQEATALAAAIGEESPVTALFALALPEQAVRERAFHTWLGRKPGSAAFWTALRADEQTAPHADRLRLSLRLGALTGNNIPLVRLLLDRFDEGHLGHPRDLARIDTADWARLIETAGGPPQHVTALAADTGTAPTTDYADLVAALAAEAYPTAHIAHGLATEDPEAPAARFLAENPQFDLVATPVTTVTVPDESARAELGGIQRLMKLSPRYPAVRAVRAAGFDSAAAIAELPEGEFTARLTSTTEGIDAEQAAAVHARARYVHAATVNLVADLRTVGQFKVPWLAGLPSAQALAEQVPGWDELFGPADYCACSDCRSVTGQAAYLVDLLMYLRRLDYGDGSVARELKRRRADLWDVQLTCDNTNLQLPYVDLVCEVLETAVVHGSTEPGATDRQTSGDPALLRVQPQHIDPVAYDRLRTAVYPWNLPFDLWGEQIRTCLDHLGVRRHQLMATLRPAAAASTPVAVEALGLPPVAGAVIAGEPVSPGRTVAEFYGRPAATPAAVLLNDLSTVRNLLDAASMRYAELLAALDTRFVNPGTALTVVSTDPADPCNTRLMTVQGLSLPALDRLHRFTRLRRALDLPAADLDLLLYTGPGPGRLDSAFLRGLVAVRRLTARLDLTLEQVVCFYDNLPTHRYETADQLPLYDRLFADPSVVTAEPGQADPFALNADRTELKVIGSLVDPVVTAALLAVLEITDEELAELVTGRRSVTPSRLLDLANLTALYRTVTLARALELPVPELLRLIELYGNGGPFPTDFDDYDGGEPELLSGRPVRHPAPWPSVPGGPDPELVGGAPMARPGHPDAPRTPSAPVDELVPVTEQFLDAVDELLARGFTVPEVDAVLTGSVPAHDGPLPDDTVLAVTLTGLRSALQAVHQQTAQTADDKGDLTHKGLALLGWDAALVDEVMTTLLGTAVYTAELAALPTGVALPPAMKFEPPEPGSAETGRLLITGPMSTALRDRLANRAVPAFAAAVKTLYQAPRVYVTTRMKALRLPVYAAPLESQPVDLKLPAALAGKVFYDVSALALRCKAYLSGDELTALRAASADDRFRAAVDALGIAQEADPEPGNAFLGAEDAAAMFDAENVSPAARFARVLTKLNPYLRRTLSEITVKQQLGAAVGLDQASADVLLGGWLRSPSKPLALEDFLTSRFVGSDPSVVITRGGFPEQFTTLILLHRVALVLTRLRITAEQIPWVFDFAASSGWLDLNLLPPRPFPGASPIFARFVRLLDLARLRDRIPGAARTLRAVFTVARDPQATVDTVLDEIGAQTRWDRADLGTLCGPDLLNLPAPADLRAETGLRALLAAVTLLRRTGVSAERATGWLAPAPTAQAAQAAWQAAKAQHPLADWPATGGALQDRLRERRRASLVAYLTANPFLDQRGLPYWHDSATLFDYFLLDVEMGACQLTTRIAQAVFSVQLFVQRLRLNLEYVSPNPYGPDLWRDWDWMRSYRLWEANQKIFLYPENYFEPDLRTTKSPFFTELENTLLQKELTSENAVRAVEQYVAQLDKASRMRPCGVYTDVPEGTESTLYVCAHTVSTPREYYIRSWTRKREWTPWERIDLDIESDTLIPVVWNGRLHLFWPTYTLASDPGEVKMPQGNTAMGQPERYWKAQLNWSRRVNGTWEAKRSTKGTLRIDAPEYNRDPEYFTTRYPWHQNFCFRPFIDPRSGDLVVFCVSRFWGEGDGTVNLNSGSFRFSPGLGETVLDDIAFHLTPYEEAPAVPVIYRTPTEFSHNEKVELPHDIEMPAYDGHVFVIDPSRRFTDQANNSIHVLRQTPGVQLYRILNATQIPLTWDQFAVFFSDSERCFLIEGHPNALPMLRDELAPGREFNRPALTAGSELVALAQSGNFSRELSPPDGAPAPSALGTAADPVALAASGTVSFQRFYHPRMRYFAQVLAASGPDALYERDLQIWPGGFDFREWYDANTDNVVGPYPGEPVEFALTDAYGDYNWELFFHVPLLIAQRLSANQRFEEAQQWFHYIFDPSNRENYYPRPQRFWITKPFHEANDDTYIPQRIQKILEALANGDEATAKLVQYWLEHPFQPDAVARLRTTAYQKAVVMKYLDNLIAWGDQLFRQDTLESVNQATQLYLLASELLGRRPEEITGRAVPQPQSYRTLIETPTAADPVVAAENLVAAPDGPATPAIRPGVNLRWLNYFCLPRNDKLAGYWDLVEDRLFKIRHCQNIDGVQRQLALFGAPIDPALLARATAAGLDLTAVLDDISAPLPHYRYTPMVAKAKELAAEVRAFGGALLAALEKRDAEALARLRSGHELALLDAAREVRGRQVKEADEALAALEKSKAVADDKKRYYAELRRTPLNTGEKAQSELHRGALKDQDEAADYNLAAALVGWMPDIKVGTPTTMGATWGSSNAMAMLKGQAEAASARASRKGSEGAQQLTLVGYERRAQEWAFQEGQAGIESEQFAGQIAAAEMRQAIAVKELQNHDLQRANTLEADRFMRGKFTNTELYDWMAAQLSTTYFQAYQLAHDTAKRAERSYRHELGVQDSSFVNFGYWDSLHRGLLAGERLAADLNRMDAAYLENNAREFELTKRISLAQLDPSALLALKETGTCYLSLPEALFDLDTPGHYFRRIRSVAVTVPCVAGPYSSVNLTVRLLGSSVRVDPKVPAGAKYARGRSDTRFRDYTGPIQTVVTSTGQDDTGLFETSLRDERFLPFEGAGVIGEWQLSLPSVFRQFDYESITDVVLHVRYTARDGGDNLARPVVDELHDALKTWVHAGGGKGLYRVFSARREFADRWTRFLVPNGAEDPKLTFTLSARRFPHLFAGYPIKVAKPQVVLVLSRDLTADGDLRYVTAYGEADAALPLTLTAPDSRRQDTAKLKADAALKGQPRGAFTGLDGNVHDADQPWTVTLSREQIGALPAVLVRDGLLNPDAVVDLLLVWEYQVDPGPEDSDARTP